MELCHNLIWCKKTKRKKKLKMNQKDISQIETTSNVIQGKIENNVTARNQDDSRNLKASSSVEEKKKKQRDPNKHYISGMFIIFFSFIRWCFHDFFEHFQIQCKNIFHFTLPHIMTFTIPCKFLSIREINHSIYLLCLPLFLFFFLFVSFFGMFYFYFAQFF